MKRVLNKIFSRFVIGVFIIILQFLWFVYLLYSATLTSSVADAAFKVISIAMALFVSSRDIRTSYKMSWIFIILALPLFGCPAYFIFGRSGLTKRTRARMDVVTSRIRENSAPQPETDAALGAADADAFQLSNYLTRRAGYPLYREQDCRYFSDISKLHAQMLEDIRGASSYIFLEYFIVEQGKMLDPLIDLLVQKAREGVDVRLLYDGIGCIQTVPAVFFAGLEKKGIKCACFQPFRPLMSILQNNRDHRKITVIDGKVAYTGGFNLADEYINEKERFGVWKDAGIRMTGAGVWSFTSMFLELWDYITKQEEDYAALRAQTKEQVVSGDGFVQPYTDSPLDHEDVGENTYLHMIEHAKTYVYMYTPYLVIGSEMRTALINAAKCGVDVRLAVPGIPDKKLVYLLTQSHFEQLIRGGVRVYKFTPGFLHAKCFVVDDKQAAVGTVNLDYRSLCLHFECGVWMYKTKAVGEVKEDFLATLPRCHEVTLDECRNRNLLVRMFMGALKLFAPLL